MAPQCPHYTPVRSVSVPIFKTFTVPASASARSWLGVFAPANDWLGQIYYQAVASPDNSTTLAGYPGPQADATITSAVAPYVDDALNFGGVPQCRVTEYCVEMTCSQALASVAGALRVGRWVNGGMGLLGSETAPQFFVANEQFRTSEPSVLSFAELVSGKCVHAVMRDRTALEFSPMRTGFAQWKNIYSVNDSPSDDIVTDLPSAQAEIRRLAAGVVGVPWEPVIVQWNGTTTPEITFTIRGRIEIAPAVGTVLYRLAKTPASPTADAEAKWWAHCRQLALSKPSSVLSGVSRSPGGYLGVPAAPKPSRAPAKPTAKKNLRGNPTTTQPKPQRTWRSSAAIAASTAAAATAAVMPYARDRAWRREVADTVRGRGRGRLELR